MTKIRTERCLNEKLWRLVKEAVYFHNSKRETSERLINFLVEIRRPNYTAKLKNIRNKMFKS